MIDTNFIVTICVIVVCIGVVVCSFKENRSESSTKHIADMQQAIDAYRYACRNFAMGIHLRNLIYIFHNMTQQQYKGWDDENRTLETLSIAIKDLLQENNNLKQRIKAYENIKGEKEK